MGFVFEMMCFRSYPCCCTGVSATSDEVASTGEDGRLLVTKYQHNSPYITAGTQRNHNPKIILFQTV